jgi:ABC-type multidrug transport system fused ATPase/permease subunit
MRHKRHYNNDRIHLTDREIRFIVLIAVGIFLFLFIVNWIMTHVLEFVIILASLAITFFLLFKYVPKFKNLFTNFFQNKFTMYGNVKDEDIKKLISVIEDMKTQEVRNEEDLEKQLFQRLDALNYSCERQSRMGDRKVDILVNSKIGVELKLADRSKNIQDLIGQVTVYKKYLEHILVVILDVGNVPELNDFIEMIQAVDKDKIAVVVIRGNINRYKKKEEYILVKKETSVKD